jgi:hypothetical protein
MSTRLALCLLLLCASFPLMARDVRMMGANGDNGGGSCQDDSTVRDDETATRAPSAKPVAHAVKPAKAKPSASHAADNLGDIRPPRWHSFLPGMFR